MSLQDQPSIADIIAAQDRAAGRCWCHCCRPVKLGDMRMVLCPTCGNKRCPKATNHRYACTRSNDPGQLGSVYEDCAPAARGPAEPPLPETHVLLPIEMPRGAKVHLDNGESSWDAIVGAYGITAQMLRKG